MSTVTHDPMSAVPERDRWADRIIVREMWASLAIAAMWLATLFTALFAPNIVSSDAGGSTTTIPSGVVVALFALIGTRIVAKYGFGRPETRPDP